MSSAAWNPTETLGCPVGDPSAFDLSGIDLAAMEAEPAEPSYLDFEPSPYEPPLDGAAEICLYRKRTLKILRRYARLYIETIRRVPDIRPDNLEDARREILRLVCLNSAAITQVVIDDALEGKYLSAKFLFETVGLCAMNADEVENPERKESLTSLLLKRWQLAAPGAISVEVTEVPDGTTVVGTPIEAPVES